MNLKNKQHTFNNSVRSFKENLNKIVKKHHIISPLYQYIHTFDEHTVLSSAPDAFLFEPFLPWIWKIMLAYQEQEETGNKQSAPLSKAIILGILTKREVNR